MKFEDYAREASRALAASGRSVDIPSVSEVEARSRRRGLVVGSTAIATLAVGTVAIVTTLGGLVGSEEEPADGSVSRVSVPAATVPVEGGGVLFGPPRIEGPDTVEFSITLLDGTRLSLTLPRSLAADIQGLVPGGGAGWELDPCCGRSLDVMYGSVDDLYGDRQPEVEYEDADGNPVGFYTEEDGLDYLVFQYGSWVVRAWDGDPQGQRFSEENRAMFASLMRGHETDEGFLVLDPAEPMRIGPTDSHSPDATFTTGTPGEGVVGVFTWRECTRQPRFANPDLVTSAGNLVSFGQDSGMTSICFPESSLDLWVSRLDLTEAEVEAIDLIYAPGQPDEEPSTTSPTTSTTSSTTTTSAIQGSGPWSVAADHPVVGRTFPVVVWTGSEVVVWGGEKPSEGAWHADGAAFDPATGTWRELADSPLAPRSEHVAVWTGEEVIICCGRIEGTGTSAGAYDPEADQWREISAPPIGPAFAEAVWTGDEMLVFGGVGIGGDPNLTGAAAYNPDTDTWRRLADLPYGLERTADAVYGDGVVFAWPSGFGSPPPEPAPLSYHIESDTWTPLPPLPPEMTPVTPSLVWTGDELIAWGLSPGFDDAQGLGMAFRPDTGEWKMLPQAPLQPTDWWEGTEASQAAAWTGAEVIVWTGYVGTDGNDPWTRVVAFDPSEDSWRELEPAPIPARGLYNEPILWTGSQLITYTDPMLLYTP